MLIKMADAEELVRRLPESADVIYSGLVLNARGVQRALRAGYDAGVGPQ